MKNPLTILKEWFHVCSDFRWDLGYGNTPLGRGIYEFEVCQDCKKITGRMRHFERDPQC